MVPHSQNDRELMWESQNQEPKKQEFLAIYKVGSYNRYKVSLIIQTPP